MNFRSSGQIYHMFDFSKQVGKYEYDPELPLYCGWDFGIGNPTASSLDSGKAGARASLYRKSESSMSWKRMKNRRRFMPK
jgi:hypothetical protein